MTTTRFARRRSTGPLLLAAIAVLAAGPALAARVVGDAAPAPGAVRTLARQQPAASADESTNLRHGTITALDPSGKRLQVQGTWLEIVEGKTVATRDGRDVALATLKVGETIRFTAVAGTTEAASLRWIYAP